MVAGSQTGYEQVYAHESGGVIWRHELADVQGIDYAEVLEVAMDKAAVGCEVHILPVLAEADPLRAVIFAGAKPRKCPDLKIDGVFTEIKTPKGGLRPRQIDKNIRVAHRQANVVIIKLSGNIDEDLLARIARGRFKEHTSLLTIEFKMNDRYFIYAR